MLVGHYLHQRQAKPEAGAARVQPHVRLQHLAAQFRRDAGAVILHLQAQPAVVHRAGDADLPARIAQRIAEQVAQRQFQHVPVDVDQAHRRQHLLHWHRQGGELGDHAAHQRRQLQPLAGQLVAAAEGSVLDAGVGEVLQPVDIGAQAAQCIALELIQRGVLEVGQAETHPRQRAAAAAVRPCG
ncbi:hypothetical protein G6F35_015646 [Rhizopus arrhizus]|nr:hypothetical protein G6F35_015646 [Rhizopus arrhizus]